MSEPQSGIQRQHELDALRAFAMLLGIALHGALAYMGFPWIVNDPKSNPGFLVFFCSIHGFRMPLFMLVSGYFTMMLWRKRGLASLLKQRALRVLLPFILGLVTILPALFGASKLAWEMMKSQDAKSRRAKAIPSELIDAIRGQNLEDLWLHLADGSNPNQVDAELGIAALSWAVLYDNADAALLLHEQGAWLDRGDKDGYTPLHFAATFGRSELVKLLLHLGADPRVRGSLSGTPMQATQTKFEDTQEIAEKLGVPMPQKEELESGRAECRRLFEESKSRRNTSTKEPAPQAGAGKGSLESIRARYRAFLDSDRFVFRAEPEDPAFGLFTTEIFAHLWFLWHLCWLVLFFTLFVLAGKLLPFAKVPSILILSPLRWLWLIPLTVAPQMLMGMKIANFGPDTSASLIPQPHVLFYYAVFFFFGALYFDCDDRGGRLTRWWLVELSLAFIVALPLGLLTHAQNDILALPWSLSEAAHIEISGLFQVIYAWTMSFGLMGLFRAHLSQETKTIRYLSDSAYWLYLTHLPPMILLQAWLRPWEVNAFVKFTVVCVLTTFILLLLYQYLVRYTWIGLMLNGPRKRPQAKVESSTSSTAVTPP